MIVSSSLNHNLPTRDTSVALGFFDGIHRGHTKVISRAAQWAEQGLAPCVFTFSAPAKSRMPKPLGELIQTEKVKRYLLENMGMEYMLCPQFDEFRSFTPRQFVQDVLLQRYRAKAVVCGENFRFGVNASAGVDELGELCREFAIELSVLPLETEDGEPISSTRIRAELKAGNIEKANRMLGHPFTLIAPVCHGEKLGRTINFPTANQEFPEEQIMPKRGVYATVVQMDGRTYAGVTNVGKKPTVGGDHMLAETFIMDFEGDLYGSELTVEFFSFLRDEQKFASLDELKAAIQKSADRSLKLYLEMK